MRIEVIVDILEYFFQPHDNKSTLYSQLAEDYNNWKSLRRYFPKIKDFYFDGIVFEDFSDPKYASIEISNKDTIMLATEFFVKQGIFFANPFNKFVKKAPTNVSFFTPNSHFSGGMLNIVSTNTQYIFSPNYKDIRKTTNFTHEAEHVIENRIRANFFKNFIINETCALFIELISTDYYNNLFGFEQQNLLRQFEILYNVKMDAGDIIVKNKILKLFNKYKNNKKRLYNRLA